MKKRIVSSISLGVVSALLFVGCNSSQDSVSYNMSPDNSKKIVGSSKVREMMSLAKIDSVDKLANYADLIVIGTVESDGVTTTAEWPKIQGEKTESVEMERDPVTVTHTKIKIEKTLFGEADSDTITLLQLGKAGSDQGETKVKKNKKMLFILRKSQNGNETVYSSVLYEDGLFEIDSKNKITSLTNNIVEAKYDGLDKDILIKDIMKGIRKK